METAQSTFWMSRPKSTLPLVYGAGRIRMIPGLAGILTQVPFLHFARVFSMTSSRFNIFRNGKVYVQNRMWRHLQIPTGET
jgi:hypothetical protein